jgi:P-type Cu+ transporter
MTSPTRASLRTEVGVPDRMMAGAPARLGLRIEDAETGEAIRDIVESHERPLHFIVVSTDLEFFRHLHPWPIGDDEYWVDVTFPHDGRYYLFLEFQRAGGETVVARESVVLGRDSAPPARLAESPTPAKFEDLAVSLYVPDRLALGEQATFSVHVTDAETGEGVTTLTPYLAAAAHVVLIDSTATWFGHAYGAASGASAGSTHAMHGGDRGHGQHSVQRFGPDIEFAHVFPAAGTYRLWLQFGKPDRTLVTVNFDVRVA